VKSAEFSLRPARVAWALLGAALLLMVVGLCFVHSSTLGDTSTTVKQVVWFGVGLTAAVLLCFVDYHVLARWAWVGYWGSIVLLLAVMVIWGVAEWCAALD
jgi:rod shape determining protein RodA